MEWAELEALQQANAERWGAVEELLATLVEVLDAFRLMWLRANSEPNTRVPDPIKVPRPGQKKPEPQRVSMREFVKRLKG